MISGPPRAAKADDAAAPAVPKITGVKVGVDYERYMMKVKEVPPNGAELFARSRLYGIHQRGKGVITENEREVSKNDEFTCGIHELFIKIEEFCIKNDELCI